MHHNKCCANHTVVVDQPALQLTNITAVATSTTYHEPWPLLPYNPEYKPYHPSDEPYPTNQPYTMALPPPGYPVY